MSVVSAGRSLLLLGKCVPSVKENAVKIAVSRMELDTYLTIYFTKVDYLYAHDPDKKCKTGDIVLIEQLPQKLTTLITHKVKEVIYKMGDVVDPLTGKKVVVDNYRDEIEKIAKLYGKTKAPFDYDKAPSRGWQEDKKDFTRKPTYIKYHEFENNDPYAI